MRRRRPFTVWPAVADLMTVLAVSGLFGSLALLPSAQRQSDIKARMRADRARIYALEAEAASLRRKLGQAAKKLEGQKSQLREAARNQKMFEAIQRAQQVVDQVSADESLRFEADQTLRFGDDLVHFAPNSLEPTWEPAGREKLKRFCEVFSRRLASLAANGAGAHELFTVQVEGHTDTTKCPGDPYCNWWISAGRAAVFVALMKQDEYCPGGAGLDLNPVGYADTRPPRGDPNATRQERRRISVRLVPNYEGIVAWEAH